MLGMGVIYSGDSISDIAQFICSKQKKWLEDFGVDDVVINGIFPAEYGYTLIRSANIAPFSGASCESLCFLRHLHRGGDEHETEIALSEKMRLTYLNYSWGTTIYSS